MAKIRVLVRAIPRLGATQPTMFGHPGVFTRGAKRTRTEYSYTHARDDGDKENAGAATAAGRTATLI